MSGFQVALGLGTTVPCLLFQLRNEEAFHEREPVVVGQGEDSFCFFLEMARADDPLWIIGPLACVGVNVCLDSDSLEGAQSLPHALDFAFVGSLVTDRLTKQGSDLGDSAERLAQVALEAVEVVDGSFNGGLVVGGNRSDVAVVSVGWNLTGSVDMWS